MANIKRIPTDMIQDRSTGQKLNEQLQGKANQTDVDTLTSNLAQIVQLSSNFMSQQTNGDLATVINYILSQYPSGVKIKIPRGTYDIKSPIILFSNVEIYGDGESTVLQTSLDISIFKTKEEVGTQYNNIKIHDLSVINNAANTSVYQIDLKNTYMCKIRDVYVKTANSIQSNVGGIRLYTDLTGSSSGGSMCGYIEHCTLSNSSIDMAITDSYITNSLIWAYGRSFGIRLTVPDVFINNNQIVGSSVNGGIYMVGTSSNYLTLIKINNNFFDGSWSNIDSGTAIKAIFVADSIINDNDVWNYMDDGFVFEDCKRLKVNNNTFKDNNRRDNGSSDIIIKGTTFNAGNNVISSNTFNRSVNNVNKGYAIKEINNGFTPNYNNYISNSCYSTTTYLNPVSLMLTGTKVAIGNTNMNITNNLITDLNVNADVSAVGGFKQTLPFYKNSIAANILLSSNTALENGGASYKYVPIPFAGSILGIAMTLTNARTAGSITIYPAKNGIAIAGMSLTIDGSNGNFSARQTYAKDTYTFAAGDVLGFFIATSSDWVAGNNLSASLVFEC